MSGRRIRGIVRRHMYATMHSPGLWFDMFVWPLLDLLVWGLLTVFIQRQDASLPVPVGFLIGAVLLWDLLFRSNLGISIAFLDDFSWTRNAINVLASPITPGEYMAGTSLWALVKLATGWGAMSLLAWGAFSFGVFELGVALVAFLPAFMLFGVALSMLVAGLVLRFGHGADILAWGLATLLLPLSAAFYPLDTLPPAVRAVAQFLPSAQAFEAMRTVLDGHAIPWDRLGAALALDVVYLAASFAFARRMLGTFQRRGYVTRFM